MVRPLALLLASFVLGCGGSAPEARAPRAEDPEPATAPAPAPPKPITSLRRGEVRETIRHGLGAFLQNVTVDDYPVMESGKFKGFKLRTINETWGIDLRPGDVITKVNGMSIEHPEDADAALRSLEKAPALRVDFEREGKAKTLELPIVD